MRLAMLETVARAGLSAAVMILAVMILQLRFQDRTPRRVFCLLWDLVLIRLLVPIEIASPVSILRLLPAGVPQTQMVARTAETSGSPMASALMEGTGIVREAYVTFVAEDAVQVVSDVASPAALDWRAVLTALWLLGAVLLAAWFLWNHLRSRKIYAASLPVRDAFVLNWLAERPLRRPVQARTSDRIAAPLTYGILYPVILLPAGMDWRDGDTLSCVLSHEHEHIRRFDALRKGLLAAALCLHWFNPLVWAMYILSNRDIELACDEAVLRSGADRESYALALLGMEERRGGWSPTGSHFSGHALEERIKAIMKRKHISITALVAVLVVMAITTTVFASAAPEGKNTNQAEDQNPPQTGYVYDHLGIVEDDGVVIMSNGETGEKLFSVDNGETWMSEERYHAEYGGWGDDWQVEWWTYEDYKLWLEEEKEVLQSIIGERGYTGSRGWFTWDQKMVDETIAMYEEILEKIKNGALYSRTIIDKNGNTMEDVVLGANAPLDMVITSVFDETEMFSVAPKALDKAELLEELKAFGIGGNENLMTYNGELIRYFVDGAPVGPDGYSVQYVYTNDQGTVDVHTLRAVIHNPDGSYDTMGDLIGVAAKGDQGFDQGLIDAAAFSGSGYPQATTDGSGDSYQNSAGPVEATQTVHAEGGSTGRGKTFEEIFAQYEAYGLVYQPREGGMGSLTYCGLPVRSFADLKPDGGVFSYQDPYAQEGLTVTTVYDADGKLAGLTTDSTPTKPIDQGKQELGFGYCTPVKGTLTAGFSQGTLQFHYGVDLKAEKGADVAAFADGTVSETGFDASKGNYVVISHENGYSTLYAHCGSIAVSAGDSVTMGKKIAEVGATGRATGAVLHFELRCGSTYLDPAQYLELTV